VRNFPRWVDGVPDRKPTRHRPRVPWSARAWDPLGGGYVMGSIASHRRLCGRLSQPSGLPVLNVDYRLGPEHPHPAAVDDALAAVRWVRAQGFAPERTIIAGDSAGGGLGVATLIALRDAGDPAARVGHLVSQHLSGRGLRHRLPSPLLFVRAEPGLEAPVWRAARDPARPRACDRRVRPALGRRAGALDARALQTRSRSSSAEAIRRSMDRHA